MTVHKPPRLRLGWHIAAWLVAGIALASSIAFLLWQGLGGPTTLRDKIDLAKVVISVTGGVGAVVFLVLAYRKQRLGEVAEEREDTRLLLDRFHKAAEQLGHPAAATRLSGVYAMAALADDWPAGRQTCVNALCAYSRQYLVPDPPDDSDELQRWHGELLVRNAISDVFVERLRRGGPTCWQGHTFDLTGAVIGGGRYSHTVLNGGAVDLAGVRIRDCTVLFSGVEFRGGGINLAGTTFSHCTVTFNGAKFCTGYFNFTGATFSDSRFDFSDATFVGATLDFTGVTLLNSTIDFADPRSWEIPPILDDNPPAGVRLP